MFKNFIKILVVFSFTIVFLTGTSFAEPINTVEQVKDAEEYFLNGEYRMAIEIYDDILEVFPTDTKIREMKAISLSNMRLYTTLAAQPVSGVSTQYDKYYLNEKSMLEFYTVLETDPNSVIALNGLGLGFGNFGEYGEAKKYFDRALKLDPDNYVSKNYLEYIEKIIKKYPYKPTEKPAYLLKFEENTIPHWIRSNASWWAADKISDNDFISGIQYLIENKIIKLSSQNVKKNTSDNIPAWVKNNAGWWAAGKIPDEDFVSGLKYLIENGIMKITVQENSELVKKELDRKAWNFEQYLRKIQSDIKNEKRFIEYPNPSS